jgi:hypothetical protein
VESAEKITGGDDKPLAKLPALIAAHLAPNETKRDYVKVFINERCYLPDASRRRIGRKGRRIERCFEAVIRAGIEDGSIRAGTDVRLTMLAILGMCNNVINWRAADQGAGLSRVAAELGKLVVDGLAMPDLPISRRKP